MFDYDILIGKRLNGTRHAYRAYTQDVHISFNDEIQESQKSFHDNVNSASCNCVAGKKHIIFAYQVAKNNDIE